MIGLDDLPERLPVMDRTEVEKAAERALRKAAQPRPNPETVRYLEGLLELARAGKIDGIAAAYTFTGDGSGFGTGWEIDRSCDFPALLGGISVLQARAVATVVGDD